MNYEEALDYIHSIPKFRRPLGNEKLAELLSLLKNPQKNLRFIHIAGTNGKGSTSAMTAEILKRAGYKTGLFTSPYIEKFNERIRINGENISDYKLSEYTERVKNIMEQNRTPVSEFAFVTAVAFLYFFEKKCDFVVLEVGMGGALDATNVIDEAVVSVICKIALDHTQYLGNTLEEITYEKCGIIKENGTVVAYPNEDKILDIIREYANSKNASFTVANVTEADSYELSLRGNYQKYNAAVTAEIINILRKKGFCISEKAVCDGFANTVWPARFELINERIIIDGAHNPDGMKALKKSLAGLNDKITIVIAMMEDKEYRESVREIASVAERIIATEINLPRCLDAKKIAEAAGEEKIPVIVEKNVNKAVSLALSYDGIICMCGSLYFAGEVRAMIKSLIT